MPVAFGVILGVLLTVAAAFAYDSATGRVPNGLPPSAAGGGPPIVNWAVISDDWRGLESNLRRMGNDIERGWKRLAG